MKPVMPFKLAVELERVARLVAQGEMSYEEAIDALEVLANKEECRLFAREVMRRKLRQMIKASIAKLLSIPAEEEASGNVPLPFSDLPPHLEVAVGTFKHQRVMKVNDWNAAVVQAETKATNAAGYFERVQRARDEAVLLLTPLGADATMADVEA